MARRRRCSRSGHDPVDQVVDVDGGEQPLAVGGQEELLAADGGQRLEHPRPAPRAVDVGGADHGAADPTGGVGGEHEVLGGDLGVGVGVADGHQRPASRRVGCRGRSARRPRSRSGRSGPPPSSRCRRIARRPTAAAASSTRRVPMTLTFQATAGSTLLVTTAAVWTTTSQPSRWDLQGPGSVMSPATTPRAASACDVDAAHIGTQGRTAGH